jgi:sugar lactone lactonase YvrE
VGDRNYRRVEVFTLDGRYLNQVFVNPKGAAGPMTAGGLAFSPDPQQQFLYAADYDNGHVHIVNRTRLEVVGSIGNLGGNPGDFRGLHTLATDSKGNLWTAETQPRPTGSRIQRLVFKGIS